MENVIKAVKTRDNVLLQSQKPIMDSLISTFKKYYPEDYELQQAACSHDDYEDTKVTKADHRILGCTERMIAAVTAMTRMPGQTEEEYQEQVLANSDAIKIKMADIRHNSDIRRLKGLTEKDFARAQKYQKFFVRLREAHNGTKA